MGRKARPALQGLESLGARLKEIRLKAGLSQMKLAGLIGFDPAHGYKYILRLEKGQVPNPTLRTIAACLEACGATWPAVVDVLPATGTVAAPSPAQPSTVAGESKFSASAAPAPQSKIESPKSEIPVPAAPSRRHDSRPMREQLRSRRVEERQLRTRRFWSNVQQAEELTRALLRSERVSTSLHRSYLTFCRACCSTIDAFESARPEVVERELARLVRPAAANELDRRILALIQSTCTQVFRSKPTAG